MSHCGASVMTLDARLRALALRAPGVVIAIVDRDGVRDRAAIGLADLVRRIPASVATPWPWFSITKVATATVAMRMMERGELDLDQPVARLVPAVARLEPAAWATRITPRLLMSHRSGIANPIPLRWIRPPNEPAIDVEVLATRRLLEHRRLRFAPGTRTKYSNLSALVLGAALQHVARTPFATLVAQEVLAPLGMTRSGFELPDDAAVGHHPRWSPIRWLVPRWVVGPTSGRWVATRRHLVDGPSYGGLVGPIDDLACLARLHLCDGVLDGVRVLAAASAIAMREQGLGWFRHGKVDPSDPPSVEHGGSGPGFRDVLRLYPSRGIAVIVLGNATQYHIDAAARLAIT